MKKVFIVFFLLCFAGVAMGIDAPYRGKKYYLFPVDHVKQSGVTCGISAVAIAGVYNSGRYPYSSSQDYYDAKKNIYNWSLDSNEVKIRLRNDFNLSVSIEPYSLNSSENYLFDKVGYWIARSLSNGYSPIVRANAYLNGNWYGHWIAITAIEVSSDGTYAQIWWMDSLYNNRTPGQRGYQTWNKTGSLRDLIRDIKTHRKGGNYIQIVRGW